ncbi:hypothetical protein EZV62_007545 [Acer yangbiense]|uniref:SAM-dependent MTase RsmB/NOP-type domain-containing protein n=1 Tax=Acer yangbiense TaxID=1000413 RepID=A0A5C7IAB6_9ROSI|nr:hypothetical protein EZV62_007545 [Acer yangbiense]
MGFTGLLVWALNCLHDGLTVSTWSSGVLENGLFKSLDVSRDIFAINFTEHSNKDEECLTYQFIDLRGSDPNFKNTPKCFIAVLEYDGTLNHYNSLSVFSPTYNGECDGSTTPKYVFNKDIRHTRGKVKPYDVCGCIGSVEKIVTCFHCEKARQHFILYDQGIITKIYGIDAASGAALSALDVSVGDHVLDLCAAPGAKLCMILDILGDLGYVTGVLVRVIWTAINVMKGKKI